MERPNRRDDFPCCTIFWVGARNPDRMRYMHEIILQAYDHGRSNTLLLKVKTFEIYGEKFSRP